MLDVVFAAPVSLHLNAERTPESRPLSVSWPAPSRSHQRHRFETRSAFQISLAIHAAPPRAVIVTSTRASTETSSSAPAVDPMHKTSVANDVEMTLRIVQGYTGVSYMGNNT